MANEGLEIKDIYNLVVGYMSEQPVEIVVKLGEKEETAHPIVRSPTGEVTIDHSTSTAWVQPLTVRIRTLVYDMDKDGIESDETGYSTLSYDKILSVFPVTGVVYKPVSFVVLDAFNRMLMDVETEVIFNTDTAEAIRGLDFTATSGEITGKIIGLYSDRVIVKNKMSLMHINLKDIVDLADPIGDSTDA